MPLEQRAATIVPQDRPHVLAYREYRIVVEADGGERVLTTGCDIDGIQELYGHLEAIQERTRAYDRIALQRRVCSDWEDME